MNTTVGCGKKGVYNHHPPSSLAGVNGILPLDRKTPLPSQSARFVLHPLDRGGSINLNPQKISVNTRNFFLLCASQSLPRFTPPAGKLFAQSPSLPAPHNRIGSPCRQRPAHELRPVFNRLSREGHSRAAMSKTSFHCGSLIRAIAS